MQRMAIQYDITHTTVYRYKKPVTFGLHRVMFRPRDSHDLRVLATDLQVSPHAAIRLIQDPHSNSVALVQPQGELWATNQTIRQRICTNSESGTLNLHVCPERRTAKACD